MTPDKFSLMMKTVDLEKLAAKLPDEVITAVQGHGLHKVAAQLMNLPEITDITAAQYIGRKLASRNATRHTVNAGLVALASLEK